MDEVSKHRLIGAAIWLTLLVIVVPGWYSQPVNFKPDGLDAPKAEVSGPIVEQAYVLPSSPSSQSVNSFKSTEVTQKSDSVIGSKSTVNPDAVRVVEPKQQIEQKLMVGQWLVKVAAFKELSDANRVLGLLDSQYKVWIKEFPASKTFSVRTGPYSNREAAERDKKKIDKALRTQSQIVQVK